MIVSPLSLNMQQSGVFYILPEEGKKWLGILLFILYKKIYIYMKEED